MVELDGLVVGDEPEAWAERASPSTTTASCGSVRCASGWRAGGRQADPLVGAAGRTCRASTSVDGLPTAVTDEPACEPAVHPNGVLHRPPRGPHARRRPHGRRARRLGVEVRRSREVDAAQYGFAAVQTFFRLGEPILELLGGIEPSGDGPAGFFGLAYTVADIDALPALYGPALGTVKDAVQPGRRIATLRHKSFDMSVATAFMSG